MAVGATAAICALHKVPEAPAFLDPLGQINTCYYYTVPKFCGLTHPNTRWLVSMIRNEQLDRIKHKMEFQPAMFGSSSYYQLLDCPQLYSVRSLSDQPLFQRQAVLYMTALGLAIYLKSRHVVKLLLEHRANADEQLCSLADAQFATHVQDSLQGDFHAYPIWVIMLRRGCYECVCDLLAAKWDPRMPICMPLRRRYERRALYYNDWLDYALSLLQERPMQSLAKLVYCMTCRPDLAKYHRLPVSVIKPESREDRIVTGLVNIDDLSPRTQMIGVKSLLELAKEYGVYLQTKLRYEMLQNCYRQMREDNINEEVAMAQALDYDPGFDQAKAEEDALINANNNARSGSKSSSRRKKRADGAKQNFVSEPTRILLHALNTEAKSCNKVALMCLLDAAGVYIKRHFYLIVPETKSKSKSKAKGSRVTGESANKRDSELRLRDARNATVLLLNLIQEQYDKAERLVRQMNEKRMNFKKDVSKSLFNKQTVLKRNLRGLFEQLFLVLLHSGELLSFLNRQDLDYSHGVDFTIRPNLEQNSRDIQQRVAMEFNVCKNAYNYLNAKQLQQANNMKTLFLNLRVGEPPDQASRSGRRQQRNANNAAVIFAGANVSSAEATPPRHVSFVRVRPRRPASEAAANAAGKSKETDEEEIEAEAEQSESAASDKKAPPPTSAIAARLSEQIERLRNEAAHGRSTDAALMADIYASIVQDLQLVAAGANDSRPVQEADDAKPTKSDDDEEEKEQEDSNEDGSQLDENADEEQEQEEAHDIARHESMRGASSGVGFGGKRQRLRWCRTRRGGGRRFQKARIFDAPPEGSDFGGGLAAGGNSNDNCRSSGAAAAAADL